MRRDHLVSLHRAAIPYIESALMFARGEFAFSGQRPKRPLSENTLNQALRSLGYSRDQITFHGFRSSFSTLAREVLRAENDLIERQLAHVEKNAVKAAYDRSFRIEERRGLMDAWGDYLVSLKSN